MSTSPESPIEVRCRTKVQLKVAEYPCYIDDILADINNELINLMGCNGNLGLARLR